jgi:uncharacterized protein (DUF2249 family)
VDRIAVDADYRHLTVFDYAGSLEEGAVAAYIAEK